MSQIHQPDQAKGVEPPVALGVTADQVQPERSIEPVMNAISEESLDREDETTETESTAQDDTADAAPSSSATPSTRSPADTCTCVTDRCKCADPDADERSDIEKQPYDFDHCTVQIAIQLLPHDGDANGRMVVVGVRSHLDTPILRLVHLNELGPLPPLVNELLDALKTELPAREQAARDAFEKKKEEKAKRKAGITASKIARGKKSKATTMATAPASSDANATDNRPRPEVQATTAPQQQMGLF